METKNLPNFINSEHWFSDDTTAKADKFNAARATLAAKITKACDARAAFDVKAPEDLTEGDFTALKGLKTNALNHRKEALALLDLADAALSAVAKDAAEYHTDRQANFEAVQSDLKEKLLASGHFEDRPFDMKRPGGLGGWGGQIKNSRLIAIANAEVNTARVQPDGYRAAKKRVAVLRESLHGDLLKMREAASL